MFVVALGFGDAPSDATRLNNLVGNGMRVVAVNTSTTFNSEGKRYEHAEHDFKTMRGFQHVLRLGADIIFLDYFWLQHMWYSSDKGGHYGGNWFQKNGHVEQALLQYSVKQFILPVDNPPSGGMPTLLTLLQSPQPGTKQTNMERLHSLGISVSFISRDEAPHFLFFVMADICVNDSLPKGK
jgi:hypothetical protein